MVNRIFILETDTESDLFRLDLDKTAKHLYGLIHARYIITAPGLAKMVILLANISMKSISVMSLKPVLGFCVKTKARCL